MTDLTTPMGIYNEWVREDLVEDRLEYSKEDLEQAYTDLEPIQIEYIQELLDDVRNSKGIINLGDNGDLVLEMIGEACHQGLDGWTQTEQNTISAFLRDIGLAVKNCP